MPASRMSLPMLRRLPVVAVLARTAARPADRPPVRMPAVEVPNMPLSTTAPVAAVCPYRCAHYLALHDTLDENARLRARVLELEGRHLNHRALWAADPFGALA